MNEQSALNQARLVELRAGSHYPGLRSGLFALRWAGLLCGGLMMLFQLSQVLPLLSMHGGLMSLVALLSACSTGLVAVGVYVFTGLAEAALDRVDSALLREQPLQ